MSETTIPSHEPDPIHPGEPPPPPPRSGTGRGLFWGILGGCLGLFVLLTALGAIAAVLGTQGRGTARGDAAFWKFGAKVAIVPIEGEIFEARETVDLLRDYAENDSVRAIVVRINSPGGAIVPSQEIHDEILRIREETGKPVVASMDSLAASGGYYIAVACEPIMANPGSITGSIGVIAQWFNMEGLMQWARLRPETITSGEMKDSGSPFKPMSDEDRIYFQNLIDGLHSQFVDAVAEGREGKLDRESVAQLADGRVYTGQQALELKLVDQLGTLHDAVIVAARQAGIKGEPRTIYPRERTPGLLDLLVDGKSAGTFVDTILREKLGGTRILYRWY
ncbi:MAG: signal peptide peptidase SppA [Thermoanaerobaculia bacterium]